MVSRQPNARRAAEALPPELPTTSRPEAVLRAWTAIEAFSCLDFDPKSHLPLDYDALPWFSGMRPKPGSRFVYRIYLGTVRVDRALDALATVFGEDQERDGKQGKKAVAGTFYVDERGVLITEPELALSSFPWAISQALENKFDELGNWEAHEGAAVGTLTSKLVRKNEEGEQIPIDARTLVGAYEWLAKEFKLNDEYADGPRYFDRLEVRLNSALNTDSDLLNSFFFRDLREALSKLDEDSLPQGARRYLEIERQAEPVDLLADNSALQELLSPQVTPPVKWPSPGGTQLVTMQQAAVNSARTAGLRDGLISVNGPPGTGKTTLLRDLVAASIYDRAVALSEFSDPSSAFFASTEEVAGEGYYFKPYHLHPSLRGHEIVVASSNNKAVENISRELPAIGAIDPSIAFRYFKSISDATSLRLPPSEDDDATPATTEETWGLLAAVLGNSKNRREFKNRFWWDKDTGFQPYLRAASGENVLLDEIDPATRKVIRKVVPSVILNENPPSPAQAKSNWKAIRKEFLRLQAEIEVDMDGLLNAAAARKELPITAEKLRTEKGEYEALEATLKEIEAEISLRKGNLEASQSLCRDLNKTFAAHGASNPPWYCYLFRAGRKRIQAWDEVADELERQMLDSLSARQQRADELRESQERKAHAESELRSSRTLLTQLEAKRAEQQRLSDSISEKQIVDDRFFEQEHDEWNLAIPWIPEPLQRKREALFIASLALHRAFIDATAPLLLKNLGAFFNLYDRRLGANDNLRDIKTDLWSSFFLIVPVVSTTFASASRMIGDLPDGSIGWLLIDEAGQATPQAALGAMMKAKTTIVVGDPLQLEPVTSIPTGLTKNLCNHFQVDDERWAPPAVSVQVVADRASQFQTLFHSGGGTRRVGVPLLVHRRCHEPMFGISNRIAYDGKMVYATNHYPPSRIVGVLGPSAWFDAPGTDGAVNSAEIERVVSILRQLAASRVTDPNLYIFSPFRAVVAALRTRIENERKLLSDLRVDPKSWTRNRIGTVHTGQGREAEAVIIVLGAAGLADGGRRNWVGKSPHLINVAVTRAKQTLYVVGAYHPWSLTKTVREVAAALPIAEG